MNECPRCSGAVAEGQEYCLECGLRLPGAGALGRSRDLGQGWILRAGLALVIAFAGASAAIAATDGSAGSAEVVTATGGFVTTTTTETETTTAGDVPLAAVEWPAGDDGWTISLGSIPQTEGRRPAEARARGAAGRPAGSRDPRLLAVRQPPPGVLGRLHGRVRLGGRGDERPTPGAPVRADRHGPARRPLNPLPSQAITRATL